MKQDNSAYKLYSRESGNLSLPIHDNERVKEYSGKILAGDIGGTNTRMALFEVKKGELHLLKEKTYKTQSYSSFQEVLKIFYRDQLAEIDSICLGVAGPVNEGNVKGTNFAWELDQMELSRITGVKRVFIINDMEAHAYGLGITTDKDYFEITKGSGISGNAAIISPGTGLGEAGLFWNGNTFQPFSTEGGHCDFSPRDNSDIELLKFLQKEDPHVSWERIISGSGIFNIYKFLKEFRKIQEPAWLTERIQTENPPVVISTCSLDGSYTLCYEVMALFMKFLAVEAAQLSLKFKATGGVFIGGGIIPHLIPNIDKQEFKRHFINSGPMNPLLSLIPVKVVLNQDTALYGAAIYAVMNNQNDNLWDL